MLFDTTPDTSGYMMAGYIFAFAVLGIYVFSLALRNRNLRQDLEMLESLKVEARPVRVAAKPKVKSKPRPKSKTTKKK